MRHCIFGIGAVYTPSEPVRRVTPYRKVYCSVILFYIVPYERDIRSRYRMVEKLLRKRFVGSIVLGCQNKTAGVFIDPVDNSRSHGSVQIGQVISAMIKQRVDKSTVQIADRRMNDHPLRFVDDNDIIVLISYVEWDVFRLDHQTLNRLDEYLYPVPGLYFVFLGQARNTRNDDSAFIYQSLHSRTGESFNLSGDHGIYPLINAALISEYNKALSFQYLHLFYRDSKQPRPCPQRAHK